MSATLRTSAIQRHRKRQEKRRRLRRQLAHATATERPALEAKLLKTQPLLTAGPQAKPPSAGGRSGS